MLPSSADSDSEDDSAAPQSHTFHISLTALLETLQIFGLTDPSISKPPWARDNPYPPSTAFTTTANILGMHNLCRITYDQPGSPLSIILTEASIRTSCDLTTYAPEYADEIPFDRHSLAFKTIMRGTWLYDAILELSSTAPDKLTLCAKTVQGKPSFALAATGSLGSARVEFGNNNTTAGSARPSFRTATATASAADDASSPSLLETFHLSDPDAVLRQSYKYSLVQKAARAMSVASKVSVRVDTQGVLSLQFMIEVEGAGAAGVGGGATGKVSFVDFRFVPLVDEEGEEGEDETFVGGGEGEL